MDSSDDDPMDDDDVEEEDLSHNNVNIVPAAATAAPQRWTCDACGCHNNQASDRNCTICGTSHNANHFGHHFHAVGSSAGLRRSANIPGSSNVGSSHGGIAAGYSAAIRAGWLARSLNHHTTRLAATTNNNSSSSSSNNNVNAAAAAQLAGMMDAAASGASMNDDFGFDDDDLWDSVMNGIVDPTNNPHNAPPHPLDLQLALGVNNYVAARNRYHAAESNRQQRFMHLEAASRAFTHSIREPLQSHSPFSAFVIEPDDMYRIATLNSTIYHPNWVDPAIDGTSPTTSTRSSRSTAAALAAATNSYGGIEISGSGLERNQIAHVVCGATEGRAVRAEQPFPRIDRNSNTSIFDPFHLSLSLSPANSHDSDNFDLLCNTEMASMQQQSRSRIYGFRVAFDNPALAPEVGMTLGGCFLVGVTSSSFTSHTESTTLLQSNAFWGIEDRGQVFEGSKHSDLNRSSTAARTPSLPPQRQHQIRRRPFSRQQDGTNSSSSDFPDILAASFSMDLGEPVRSANNSSDGVVMNSHSVLFGVRDVVTVICDMDNRSLTFWRNDALLGTLVSNLPRSGNLHPVAVPFNSGSTVAITSIKGDPLKLLQRYATDWRQKQIEKNLKIKSKLAKERMVLIKEGKPTPKLQKILYQIFKMYAEPENTDGDTDMDHIIVTEIMACRLWYRCGMKLSTLENIFKSKGRRSVAFEDFFFLIQRVIDEEGRENMSVQGETSGPTSATLTFEIGDKVELVEGFDRYGDTSSGPLQLGDRGIVVDVQKGANGEIHSVRVLHSGRRWWYHVQVLISEKSGLIESPIVWFLSGILRSHGFDYTSLSSFVAKSVTPQSWRVGDIVTHKCSVPQPTSKKVNTISSEPSSMIGHIVMDTSKVPSSTSITANRQNNTVAVEFISRDFAEAVGVKLSSSTTMSIETRRVKTTKLVHTTDIHGNNFRFPANLYAGVKMDDDLLAQGVEGLLDPVELFSTSVNEQVVLNIEAMRCLDRQAIDSLSRQCRKSSDTLASMFAAGLPDVMMEAICIVERQMNSLEPKDDLPDNLKTLGNLATALTEQLYGNSLQQNDHDDIDIDVNETPKSMPWQNSPRNVQNREQVRSNVNNVAQREILREDDRRGESQFLASSLQQRQNLLLSLMSRASRANGHNANDMGEVVTEPFGHIPRALAQTRTSSPFRLGGSGEPFEYEEQIQSYEDARIASESSIDLADASTLNDDKNLHEEPEDEKMSIRQGNFFDELLRCRSSVTSTPSSSATKQAGAAFAVFVRRLIRYGILFDSAQWTEALIAGYCRNHHIGSHSKVSRLLRCVVDEEGTSILELAIVLGCCVGLIGCLIKHGVSVGNDAVVKAAATNQPKTLSLLLQHVAYEEGIVDLELCSPEVRRILILTKSRQDELSKRMEDAAGGFMTRLLIKLIDIGLSSRQVHNARIEKCGKIISEILVGNVLLKALQVNQKATLQTDDEKNDNLSNQNERLTRQLSKGLLGALPAYCFRDLLFRDEGNITKFFLLCEDYLCSKDMADIASGLTFLSLTLSKFPQIKSSSEMERFGIYEFISNHKVLSSNRIADILSKELNIGLDVSVNCSARNDAARCTTVPTSVVSCPKKHTATLHITPHSSFRCDICTSAVPKGEYIFGCRQCDYDECLQCTLRDEKRTLGVQMVIRELASECYLLLVDKGNESSKVTDRDFDPESHVRDELKSMSRRLLQRDVLALKDLGMYLKVPGRITIHEFLTVILPSLHASIAGSSTNSDGPSGHIGTIHRSKKARASRGTPEDSLDSRMTFCRKALRLMVSDREETDRKASSAKVRSEAAKEVVDCSLALDNNDGNDGDNVERLDISGCAGVSELLRRLHQILSFYENVPERTASIDKNIGQSSSASNSDLHELAKPLELLLSPSFHERSGSKPKPQLAVYAELLIPLSEFHLHILRAYRIDSYEYNSYCQRLVDDMAIIIERPKSQSISSWKIAKIERYDMTTGAHTLQYATGWKRGKERSIVRLDSIRDDITAFTYDAEASMMLAAREYYILLRNPSNSSFSVQESIEIENHACDQSSDSGNLTHAIGSRVESNCCKGSSWKVLTLTGIDAEATNMAAGGMRFVLVSDDGEVFSGVSAENIRAGGSIVREESSRQGRPGRLTGDERNSLFPYLALRERIEFSRSSGDRTTGTLDIHGHAKALKRTWSALSLMDVMSPVDLKIPSEPEKAHCNEEGINYCTMECALEESAFQFVATMSILEHPPLICIHLSAHEKLPTMNLLSTPDTTLISALNQLHQKQKKWNEWPPKSSCRLFFSLEIKFSHPSGMKYSLSPVMPNDSFTNINNVEDIGSKNSVSRCRKLSATVSHSLKDDESSKRDISILCEGIDEICVQCMEVIGVISDCAKDPATPSDREILNLPGFANLSLSSKLVAQLNQAILCVGVALPDWCLVAPAIAPHMFTYESRRMLLERTAFGPSRSTLCQQESKVNVGKLRQRMTSLRARAVELVGEAFAGGADDPTALQLQADELYGMEEALASRVKAAFRAAKWQEHALQVAKAAVRRHRLLSDAALIMDKYTNDRAVCRRRLEVRFEGESGFDAASGDEAGVTRGFYADVAEALLSLDIVAGVCGSSHCLLSTVPRYGSSKSEQMQPGTHTEDDAPKLPLWIPDIDANTQVIIPTPRAAKGSCLGLFPRPIPKYHPHFDSVVKMFRLMGRLFAAALRDGFMFPVPLSAAFLKLVQHGSSIRHDVESGHAPLIASDLPRPGFLGGEVYAADYYVCRALDRLDAMDPPLSRLDLKRAYEDISTDPNFARVALGKLYDCSFEEYFQDRTFVDPIDPAQDADAAPLCHRGHTKSITIFNVREWVTLAKNFMLYDGVIEQAKAFRRGVDDFFSSEYLRVFTSDELQRDVCGVGDDVDNWNEASIRKLFKLDGGNGATEALVAVAAIGGEGGAALSRRFGPTSPTISFLIKALLEASSTQRRQFLNFVTSVPIASVKMGTIEVVPILSPSGDFLQMHDPSCLPRANTCSRRLYLPRFETYEIFSEVLWTVVREESQFKGFYEWRGS